jgi:hypothetical protein
MLREQEGLTATNNVMGRVATSVMSARAVDGEILEGVDESRLVYQPAVDSGNMGLSPARVSMRGDTEIEGSLKQVNCEKTDPNTGGMEPGTQEGAWETK